LVLKIISRLESKKIKIKIRRGMEGKVNG